MTVLQTSIELIEFLKAVTPPLLRGIFLGLFGIVRSLAASTGTHRTRVDLGMPQKDDFLSRLQEQVRLTLGRVRELERSGQPETALVTLHDMQRRVTGLDSDLLHRLPSPDLLLLLSPTGVPNLEKSLQCAELLDAEDALLRAQGGADAALAQKALALYLNALGTEPGLISDYGSQLEALAERLGYVLPPETQGQLVEIYAEAGRYADAENWLYRWGQGEPEAARVRAEAFYHDLLALDDTQLEDGGLPRNEVEEGLAALS